MGPDLRKMEEVNCPDCNKQLIIVPVPNSPNRYRFDGCSCDRKEFDLPDCIAFGLEGAPLWLYKPKSN